MRKKPRKSKQTDRAKRRAESQRIGQEGELIFQTWAVRNFLNPHKSNLDIGIDFFCERLRAVATGAQEMTGIVLVAQVRATSRDRRPYVKLGRTDVVNALCVQQPYCLFAVSISTDQVWFRFLDERLFEDWTAFLKSKKATFKQFAEHMQSGSDVFASRLSHVSRPAFRSVLEQQKARARLAAIIPGAAFEIRGGPSGFTLVTLPELTSIFQLEKKGTREQAIEIFFAPQPLDTTFESALRQLPLHEPFEAIKDLTLGPMVLVGEGERPVRMFIECEGAQIESEFLERRVGDQRAYIGRSGLVVQMSDARKDRKSGRHYHDLRGFLQPTGAADLASSGQLPFLKLLRPGARINEVGRAGIEIESFGLETLGEAVAILEKVFGKLGIALTQVKLTDLADREFAKKVGFLWALLDSGTTRPLIRSFVIPSSIRIDERNWRAGRYRLPIALNLAGRGIILWTEGEADAYLYEDVIHGFRYRTAALMGVEAAHPEHPGLEGIEAWVYRDWPGVPLVDVKVRTLRVEKHGTLPVGGEFSSSAATSPTTKTPTQGLQNP